MQHWGKIALSILSATAVGCSMAEDLSSAEQRTQRLEAQVKQLEKQVAFLVSELQKQQAGDTKKVEQVKPAKKNAPSPKETSDELTMNELLDTHHGPAVVTSPALGVRRSAEDGNDMMVKLSSVNEDLALLKLRHKMEQHAQKQGLVSPERPILAISGGIEGTIDYYRQQNYVDGTKADIDLSRAELDFVGLVSPWVTTAINFAYDASDDASGKRANNSRVRVDRGFITIGQLDRLPLYFTIGQVVAPFGKYGSNMVSSAPIRALGRIKDRMALIGFAEENNYGSFNAQLFALSGDTKPQDHRTLWDHTGLNFDYSYAAKPWKVMVGASVTGNMAEADGIVKGMTKASKGSKPLLSHRVAGLNTRMRLEYDKLSLSTEYAWSAQKFAASDLTFNGKEARLQALQLEGAVNFDLCSHASTLAFGYGRTWQALGIGQPKHMLFASYSIVLLKNALLGLEYRHDINYGANDIATLKGLTKRVGARRHSNHLGLQLGVYF